MELETTALLERLDPLRFPIALYASLRYRKTYYSTALWPFNLPVIRWILEHALSIKKLSLTDFPAGYQQYSQLLLDQFNPTEMKNPYSREIQNELRKLIDHPLIVTAFEKTLAGMASTLKTRSWFFIKSLASHGGDIFYLPLDKGLNRSELTESVTWHVPRWMVVYNSLCQRIETLMAAIYALSAVIYLMGQRGISRRTPSPRPWKLGYDVYNTGIPWKAPYRESFIFDQHQLKAEAILHVVRNRLSDRRTRDYYREQNITCVEASALPIPLSYAWHRLIGTFLKFSFTYALKSLKNPDYLPYLNAANELIYHNLVRAELLDRAYPTEIFIGRDEYAASHILRTMLHHARGGRTIGFSHGTCLYKQLSVAYLSYDTFCFTSPYQQDILRSMSVNCAKTQPIGVGIYGLDQTFEWVRSKRLPTTYLEQKKRYRVIGILGDEFHNNEDYDFNRTSALSFYKTAFSLTQAFPDIYLIVCPKRREFNDSEFEALLADCGDRITLDTELTLYELIPVFDFAVSASTTAGLETIAAACPTLFFDEHGDRFDRYEKQIPSLVTHSREELISRMDSLIRKNDYFQSPGMDLFQQTHGLRFDGKVCERFRNEVYDLLKPMNASVLSA